MITVKTKGWIIGRNGMTNLKEVQMYRYGNAVKIDGVGVRGTVINGGLEIEVKAMDRLAKDWLQGRGLELE